MITGNFALLAGIAPGAINEWYMVVYADAYEWVELPNTHGMAIFADGGIMASKPYAASGAYIDRMSDHCAGCRYKVKEKTDLMPARSTIFIGTSSSAMRTTFEPIQGWA